MTFKLSDIEASFTEAGGKRIEGRGKAVKMEWAWCVYRTERWLVLLEPGGGTGDGEAHDFQIVYGL